MVWTLTIITFIAATFTVAALVYAFSPGELAIVERLSRLWRPASSEVEPTFREKQQEKVHRVLTDVGKLLPTDSKKLSHTQRLMVRAGYRRPESALAMRGVKLLLPVVFVSAVYFTGFYQENPFFIIAFALTLGFLLPEFWLTWKIRKRQHILRLSLPDALDLLVVCVEAGLGMDQGLMRVAQELRLAHPELCEELDLVTAEIRVGKTRMDALRQLAERTGVDDIKALVAMLVQTDRFGTSIAQSLRVHSEDLRMKRRQRAEEAAAKTTVKMVPPLVFFIFPALYVVLLGPAVITIVRTFINR